MNPNDETQRGRLFKAMESSHSGLEPFRNLVHGLVDEYAGSGYGHNTRLKHEVLINLMNQTVDAYTMALAANRPRILVSTRFPELAYFAKQFQTGVNHLIEEIRLEETIRQWVLDAFFCVGIVKVHMADAGPVLLEQGLWMDPGTPYASNVSLDNWVHDMGATRYDQVQFAGDTYRIPFEDLKTESIYDQEVVKDLAPTSKYAIEEDRLERITRGADTDNDELLPMIDLCDVWIPRDERIDTYALDSRARFAPKGKPVASMPWKGAEFGPYHLMGFNDVPENIMPTSPASHLASLSRLANNLLRKNARRAKNQKRHHCYTPAGAQAAQRMQRSPDDAWIQVQDKNDISLIEQKGADGETQSFMMGVVEIFDRMAGNLTAMLGLGPQADTVGQEQLIHGAVSKKEAQMGQRVMAGTVRLVRDLGWMLWNDKVKVLPGKIPVEGAEGYFVDATWTPEDREGDFLDYNFDLDLFSMPYQAPQQRVDAITKIITTVYAPFLQMIMAQGGNINFQELNDIYSEMLSEPRLKKVIQFSGIAPEMPESPTGQPPQKAMATTRNYVRRSVPTGGTMAGRQHTSQQNWLALAQGNQHGQAA